MRVALGKFAFKAIFAAAVFFGAATLWLMLATNAEAAGGDPLSKVANSTPLSGVTSTLTSTTKSVGDLAHQATTGKSASATTAAQAPSPAAATQAPTTPKQTASAATLALCAFIHRSSLPAKEMSSPSRTENRRYGLPLARRFMTQISKMHRCAA